MRRNPLFLVVDVDSPVPNWHLFVSQALTEFIGGLQQDPLALEGVWLSLIVISDPPIQIFPLTELAEVNCEELLENFLQRKSSGSIGRALKLTTDCIQAQCQPTTPTKHADFRAIVASILGYARLLDIAEGTAVLALVQPASSYAYSFSVDADRAVASFVDCSINLEPEDSPNYLSELLLNQWKDYFREQDSESRETIFEKSTRWWRSQSISTVKQDQRSF